MPTARIKPGDPVAPCGGGGGSREAAQERHNRLPHLTPPPQGGREPFQMIAPFPARITRKIKAICVPAARRRPRERWKNRRDNELRRIAIAMA